ncbi:MAG: alginate export family protein [Verrucomicrobiae bacterium]|nr:alginate export family protein [Verrucomicrobiae bacterium]
MKKTTSLLLSLALLAGAGVSTRAAEYSSDPAKSNLRKNIVTSDIQPESDSGWKFGDPITAADGKVIFDVQERLRFEWRDNNFDFNGGVESNTDDAYVLQRVKIGMRIKPDDWWNIYTQAQDSREINSQRPDDPGFFGAEGDSAIGLKQANVTFANYKELPFGITVGRQELSYGDERLIGAFDWNNIGRVFDGVKMRFQQLNWNVEGFAVMPVNMRVSHFNDTDYKDRFFGVYYTMNYIPKQTTDFYVFFRNKTNVDSGFPTGGSVFETDRPFNSVAGTQKGDYVTLGTRMKSVPGQLGPWDYALEANGQVGSINANAADTSINNATSRRRDLLAFAGFVQGGYTFEGPMRPRFGVGYDYATGDGNPNDGTNTSFQNLFPTNHKFYGFMDFFAWRNIHNPRAGFSITPVGKLNLSLDYHAFFLDTTGDSWFRANASTPVRAVSGRANVSNFVGQEIDLVARYPLFKWMRLEAGYSHFFTGDYLRTSGSVGSSDADFAYVQTIIQF